MCAGRPINHTCNKRNKCYETSPIVTKLLKLKPYLNNTNPACKNIFEDIIKEANKLANRINE